MIPFAGKSNHLCFVRLPGKFVANLVCFSLETSFAWLMCFKNRVLFNKPMIQVTSIRVEISNHPNKMSFTKEHRKHKRAAVNIHKFTTFSAEESSYE